LAREMAATLEAMTQRSPRAARAFSAATSRAAVGGGGYQELAVQQSGDRAAPAPWMAMGRGKPVTGSVGGIFVDLHEGPPHAPARPQAQLAKVLRQHATLAATR